MKKKLKNITVPYYYCDNKNNTTYYIYKDNKYYKLNELFKDFINYELNYHIEIDKKEIILHNLSDVIEELVLNPKSFKIAKEYYEEYSEDELSYIKKLQKKLLNNELKPLYERNIEPKYSLRNLKEIKYILFTKDIFKKYKDIIIPKKIYSNYYKNYYYVSNGYAFDNIIYALEEVYNNSLYYQYGSKVSGLENHFHSHSFDEVINSLFYVFDEFKILKSQEEFYSKQELDLLKKLCSKLKKLNYIPYKSNYSNEDYEEYRYLKDNKKYIKLLIYNIKLSLKDIKDKKERLKSHKIKELL